MVQLLPRVDEVLGWAAEFNLHGTLITTDNFYRHMMLVKGTGEHRKEAEAVLARLQSDQDDIRSTAS